MKSNLLHEFFNSQSDACPLEATQQEALEKAFEEWYDSRKVEFEESARPLIKFLAENHNPHCTAIVTNTNAELVEGKMTTGTIMDYIKD